MPIEISMPALSPTMTDGTLASWLKKEGDVISAGDVIAEIETDKATMEVEAVDEGVLGKILVPAGSAGVLVNTVIALLLEDGEDKKALKEWKPAVVEVVEEAAGVDASDAPKTSAPAAAGIAAVATAAPTPPKVKKKAAAKASPVAKRLAEKSGVSLTNVIGTGPGGRIVQHDVEQAAISGGVSRSVTRDVAEFELMPNSGMRKVVAKRLTESKQQVPHFYLSVDCNLDRLLDIRKQLNGKAAADAGEGKPSYKLSVNDLVIKAVAMGMRDVPEANASWYDDAITQYTNVDISVAVAIEGGLITPIVKNADQKSLPQISNEMKSLAGRARKGELQPDEYQGGGFSISNLGMFGVKNFSAIVNPPQACILAVGAGDQQAIVKSGKVEIATVMTVTLSVDHRAVDGAVGATFLQAFKRYIESPATMLM
jgi:pyruvate dehydrogenase E2 component (dihydrolipoamide acetyltransferase)